MSLCYTGFFAENSGYGEAARRHLLALHSAGVTAFGKSVLLTQDGGYFEALPSTASRDVLRLLKRAADHDTQLVHTPPPLFGVFHRRGARNIGVTAYETLEVPSTWKRQLDLMDEIWVPSRFCAGAFSASTRRPIRVVPHPIEPLGDGPSDVPGIDRDTFVFLSIFEWSDRKNPEGLLAAFKRAFPTRQGVTLLLKVGCRFQPDREKIVRAISDIVGRRSTPRVFVCFENLSPRCMGRLLRRANAYVSLHRAEGFGLTMADAMEAGKPVVATAYSGNMDYMSEDSAYLVDYRPVRIRERWTRTKLFDRRLTWAEPNVDAAVAALRACVDNPAERDRIAFRGRQVVLEKLGAPGIGAQMKSLLRNERARRDE